MYIDANLSRPALRLLPRSRLTVGTILREPVETVLRFVAWYLEQEADRIVLCFDDPEDPAIELVEGLARVECIRCTADFWQGLGLTSETRFTRRQNRAMSHVYASVAGGWFLNVDSDELLHLDGRSIAQEVGSHDAAVRAIRFEPAEYLQTPDSAGMHFRCLMKPWMQRKVYGDLAPAMKARMGLMGHFHGKSATRAGLRDSIVRQHWVETREEGALSDVVLGRQDGAYLLHFVDQGFETWCAKIPWRLSTRGFRGPIRDLLTEVVGRPGAEAGLRDLYDAFFVFDRDRLDRLGEVRARYDLAVDPDEIVARHIRSHPVCSAFRRLPEKLPDPLHIA